MDIHEFSTGIKAEINSDGSWFSLGFTQEYMNSTIDPIPEVVEMAIANNLFKVAEGKASEDPAIIGRVIDNWSVIALVTRGQDEQNRPISLYRYFLCEMNNGLLGMVKYLLREKRMKGIFPVFNPLDKKKIGQYNQFPDPTEIIGAQLNPELLQWLSRLPSPILPKIDSAYDNIETINDWAKARARMIETPVAWAYNVEALDNPWSFTIIHPANDSARLSIHKILSQPRLLPASPNIDLQGIKSAIQTLINSSSCSSDGVKKIINTLENKQISSQDWQKLFEGEGAENAIKKPIYTKQTVRLLTLQAIVIPKTIPEFLQWLYQKNSQELLEISSQFQKSFVQKIGTQRDTFNIQIEKAIDIILSKLLTKKVDSQSIVWLLNSNGAWQHTKQKLIKNVEQDLELIGQHKNPLQIDDKSFLCSKKIWEKLIKTGKVTATIRKNDYYQPFIDLFVALNQYKLAAYFTQITNNYVSKELFRKAGFNPQDEQGKLYGIIIRRKILLPEKLANNLITFIKFSWDNRVLLLFLIFYGLVCLAIGSFGTIWFLNREKDKISPKKLQQALAQYQTNVEETKNIISQLEEEYGMPQQLIETSMINLMKTILENSNLNSKAIINDDTEENNKKEWIEAIYNYEKIIEKDNQNLKVDGIIEGETTKSLKSKLEKKLTDKNYIETEYEFDDTSQALQTIINDMKNQLNPENEDESINVINIINTLKEILGWQQEKWKEIAYTGVVTEGGENTKINREKQQLKWVGQIYQYQNQNKEKVMKNPDGKIKRGDDTFNLIKTEMEEKLKP